jgi:hypothetical protein
MKGVRYAVVSYTAVCLLGAVPVGAGTLKCPPDSVKVGTNCIDTYEASAWLIPPSNKSLVTKVQSGKATLEDLTKGGATLLSPSASCSPDYPANFPSDGNWTPVLGSNPPSPGVYAVSIPGVRPTACITWFRANQACLLSGKRLLTNREWQGAAAGTPDPGTDNGTSDCHIGPSRDAVNTGSRSSCKSSWGVSSTWWGTSMSGSPTGRIGPTCCARTGRARPGLQAVTTVASAGTAAVRPARFRVR